MLELRLCKKCGLEKPINEFPFRDKDHKYRRHSCITCWHQYQNSRYDEGKSNHYRTDYRNKSRKFVYDYLLLHPCIDCGEKDPCCLDFDHINMLDKHDTICSMIKGCYSVEKIKKEIEKCEVRCANCHRKKTAKDFSWYKDLK